MITAQDLTDFNMKADSKKLVAILLLIEIITILLTVRFSYIIAGVMIAMIVAYVAFQRPIFGIYVVILLHVFIIRSTKELNIYELFYGILLISTLGGWFLRKRVFHMKKVAMTSANIWLSIFLITCFFSILPALIFRVNLLWWFRELVPFCTLFLFFPIVDMTRRKHIERMLLLLFLLGSYVAIHNLFLYQRAIREARFFWQLQSLRQTANEPLLFTLLILSISFIAFFKSKRVKLMLALLTGLYGIALFTTFSRGYWVATLISMTCVILLAPKPEKMKAAVFIVLFAAIAAMFFNVFFGHMGQFVLRAIGERFASLGKTTVDISLLSRMNEARAVIERIQSNPILGYGLGMTFRFKSLVPKEMPTSYVHNGFLYLFFKLGLLGGFSFVIFYMVSLLNGYLCIKRVHSNTVKALLIGMVSCLVAMLPLSFSSPQFTQKDSLLIIVLGTGIIEVIRKDIKYNGEHNEQVC